MATIGKILDETEIPEVLSFMNAKERLDEFKAKHERIFKQLAELAEDYNTKRQDADKKVRILDVSCGPWERFQVAVTYDVEKLYESVGKEQFIKLGGKLKTITVPEMEKDVAKTIIAKKMIPPKVIEAVEKSTPKYHSPDPIVVP